MATRIGVDIGGTFTDLVFYDELSNDIRVAKVPTTPTEPEKAVIDAVTSSVPDDFIARTRYFLHGTTVGLNALLERRGAKVGLLATQGFRDILEIRRGDRDEMYNLFWQPPPALVPRHLRLPISERMTFEGKVYTAFCTEDVEQAAEVFKREGVTSVAIAFMHAYANPAHELEAEAVLRSSGFRGDISLSHQISGEYREYERTCTTVIDAYVRGRMTRYLEELAGQLQVLGFAGNCLITRSGSGSMSFAEAQERPFETIMSGPVAGAEGAGALARQLGLKSVITADVGGTSFDTCLVLEGRPQITYEGRIVGLPVQSAWVDVRSIGAGGGSLAQVDVGGLLRVGPQSAGADPGPACYGRGGSKPTVTDAAFYLGMLGDGQFSSGTRLDKRKAETALKPLADKLGLSLEQSAIGIMKIATANMANAIREITVEQGIDPRAMSLLAFGGAGPMMSTLLAEELAIKQIIIPPYAGNFSALGLLTSDLTQAAARTRIMPLNDVNLGEVNKILSELFYELESRQESATDKIKKAREVKLDMRYQGQEYTLTVAIESDKGQIKLPLEQVRDTFVRDYKRTFSSTMDDAVEIVSVRASSRTALPHLKLSHSTKSGQVETGATIEAYSFTQAKRLSFRSLERSALTTEEHIVGPVIINEETATTYLDAGFKAQLDPSGALFIQSEDA